MKGRHGWRLAALLSAVCWCGVVAAQQPGRPNMQGVLIYNLGGVRRMAAGAAPAVQPGTEFEQFRERVDCELSFIDRVCSLAPDERQALDDARTTMVDKFVLLLGNQAGNDLAQLIRVQRRAVAKGRVAVVDARGRVKVYFPDNLARAGRGCRQRLAVEGKPDGP